jgi:hypothetical protein
MELWEVVAGILENYLNKEITDEEALDQINIMRIDNDMDPLEELPQSWTRDKRRR